MVVIAINNQVKGQLLALSFKNFTTGRA